MRPKLHVALNVHNLEESLEFYQALWGVEPVSPRWSRWEGRDESGD